MPRDVQRSEWKALKDQFDELIRNERAEVTTLKSFLMLKSDAVSAK